ncbi:hypothetical protein V8G56_01915 [Gaetbulibacter aquiaggeris]|uniref:Uncharacterized protein n=1 Tax=Gaetbulibacter aquiaggeris TaxID=1735373 RepID=A0ABW7MKY2_9FLAO
MLLDNLDLLEDRGLSLNMSGKTFKKFMSGDIPINEQKLYKVDIWVGAYPLKILVFSDSSSTARLALSKLFPKARVYFAKETSGKIS